MSVEQQQLVIGWKADMGVPQSEKPIAIGLVF
jgi:hypothetical protein